MDAFPRSTGVLLHPTALPESPVCGGFGKGAREWLKQLSRHGIGVWQFLPLSPTDESGSPYSSPSSFALNPWFLDAEDLFKEGFISAVDLKSLPGHDCLSESKILMDFALAHLRVEKLGRCLRDSWKEQSSKRHESFKTWSKEQFWLEDHAIFMQLRRQYKGIPWWEWPSDFSLCRSDSIRIWKKSNAGNLLEHRLLQWHLDRQWQSIRTLAKDLGVLLFGDLPFYVSRDSVDVWKNRELFTISSKGKLDVQSGVPPDYFSSTGQLWGTPVYRWSEHVHTQFEWWRKRFARQWQQVDLLRVDHFRAFSGYWSVPGSSKTAESGEWKVSPGLELLKFVRSDANGNLPLIAEDLGVITSDVEELRDTFNLPGMKILQFAFDGDCKNPYLPENIIGNHWVVYTGTHDNPTTIGWWNELDSDARQRVIDKVNNIEDNPVWELLRVALSTESCLVITPLQDLLQLTDEARFNTPGTVGKNWSWRIFAFDQEFESSLAHYCQIGCDSGRSIKDASKLPYLSSSL